MVMALWTKMPMMLFVGFSGLITPAEGRAEFSDFVYLFL